MPDWINDDGTFKEGWLDEANIPAEHRDYAKDARDLQALIKRGVDTQKEFHNRVVKIPTDSAERERFLSEHFTRDLEARDKSRADAAAAAAKKQADAAAEQQAAAQKKQAEERLAQAEKAIRENWGASYETNLELARRAARSDHCPPWIREGIAQAAGVEPDKLTDEDFKKAIAHDPAVAQTLLTIGNLTKDGRTETGDGHHAPRDDEEKPLQPACPHLYANLPETHPIRKWFARRGIAVEPL